MNPDEDLGWLRPYQQETIEKAYKATRGIVELPTAGGKGEIIVGLCKAIPIRWLVLTPNADLLENAYQRWMKRVGEGEMPGKIGDGNWDVRRVTVATVQTIMSRMRNHDPRINDVLTGTEGLLIDEVHGFASPGAYNAAMSFRNAYYRIGFSATPLDRPDGRNMLVQAATGGVIQKIDAATLRAGGYLVMPTIYMHECYQEGDHDDFGAAYEGLVVRSTKRNDMIVDLLASPSRSPRPVLCFVKRKDHGRRLMKRLEKRGVAAAFATGDLNRAQRTMLITALVNGSIDVLVATIFKEGVDIPSVMTVVNAPAGESAIDALQKVGRGSRLHEDKAHFIVHDVFDRDLGDQSSARWLERHARSRVRSYEKAGYTVQIGGVQQALAL